MKAAPETTTRVGLRLTPFDTLFFRDGRPMDAAARPSSGVPMPQTLAGAVRTFLLTRAGCDFKTLRSELQDNGLGFPDAAAKAAPDNQAGARAVADMFVRGPWFARGDGPLVPVPGSLRQTEPPDPVQSPTYLQLRPFAGHLPGWHPKEPGMLPLWTYEKHALRALKRHYLTPDGLKRFLRGEAVSGAEIVDADDLFDFDQRVGIAMEPGTFTTAEGQLYALSLLALKPDVTLYAELWAAQDALALLPTGAAPVALGGENRRVLLERLPHPFDWPRATTGGNGRMLLMTTPGLFRERPWCPPGLEPLSAAVPGYDAVSGWDLVRGGPKPNRFAAAAGSVWFLKPDAPFTDGIDPNRCSLCDERNDAQLGYGCFVEGVWRYV